MEALLPRCSAEHRELSTIRPNLIRTRSNRPELSLSIQQFYPQWSPSLKPERYGYREAYNNGVAPQFLILNCEFLISLNAFMRSKKLHFINIELRCDLFDIWFM